MMKPKPTVRFVAYEISPCVEEHTYYPPGGDRVKYEYQAVQNLKGLTFQQKQHLVFTLYGEWPDGTVEALVDRGDWDNVVCVYEAITGCRVPRKLRNTRMKHLSVGES